MYRVIGTARDLGINKDLVPTVTVMGIESRGAAETIAAGMASRADLEVIEIIDEDTIETE